MLNKVFPVKEAENCILRMAILTVSCKDYIGKCVMDDNDEASSFEGRYL